MDRITVEEALQHPWLAEYHDEDREPSCQTSFDFDNIHNDLDGDLPVSKIRKLMAEEIFEMRTENGIRNNKRGEVSRKTSGGVAEQGRDMPQETAKGSVPAPPAVPPAKPVPAASSEPSPLPVAEEATVAEELSAAAMNTVQESMASQMAAQIAPERLFQESLFQSVLRRELEKMEERIVSRMKIVVDEVVSTRLKEFAQSFDEDDE